MKSDISWRNSADFFRDCPVGEMDLLYRDKQGAVNLRSVTVEEGPDYIRAHYWPEGISFSSKELNPESEWEAWAFIRLRN